jgi:GTP-binding protein
VHVAVNKAEGMNSGMVEADFHELGLGEPNAISSAHGEGVRGLVDLALAAFPEPEEEEEKSDAVRVAIVGRPNVGKSTLVNTLLGEERVIAFDAPGTTRDAIEIDFERGGRKYVLVDTAGMRKRGKVFEAIEKFSVVKTLQSIEDANVVILMVDAQADVSDQDAHIADFIVQSGRALVVAVNKWDGLDSYTREQTRLTLQRKLKFLDFAKFHFISARDNIGLEACSVGRCGLCGGHDQDVHAAPDARPDRCGGQAGAAQTRCFSSEAALCPPGWLQPADHRGHPWQCVDQITDSYRRYLEHTFREAFKLQGTPLRIQFVTSKNPFADKDKK